MKGWTILIALTVLVCVDAHITFTSVTVGGSALEPGDCMRPHPTTNKDSPISSVTSPDMTCGFLPAANTPANRKCPITAGSKIGLQWWHYTPGGDIVDPSHKGPCIVYLAKSDTGAGAVWFKIYEDGYNPTTKQWCVDKLIANNGYFEATIPSDIAPGNYLLRGEIIALHGAHAVGGAQPYVGCVELTISGSGSANPSGVAIPGAYTDNDPGIYINIYYPEVTNYIIPGPPVYQPTSGGATSSGSGATSSGASTSTGSSSTTGTPTQQPTNSPAPSTSLTVYDDTVKTPFEDWSWASDSNPAETTVKYAGSASYRFKPQKWEAIYFWCQGCIDTTKHAYVEFYINGGTKGGQAINFNMIKGTSKVSPDKSVNTYTGAASVAPNTWAKGVAQLTDFAPGVYDGIWFQDSSGGTTNGDVYIDAIRIVAKGDAGSTGTTVTGSTIGKDNLESSAVSVGASFVLIAAVAILSILL